MDLQSYLMAIRGKNMMGTGGNPSMTDPTLPFVPPDLGGSSPNQPQTGQRMIMTNPPTSMDNTPGPITAPVNPNPNPNLDAASAYKSMIGDQPAETKYKNFIDQGSPDKANFKPTKMNRLAAILGGVSSGIKGGAQAGINTANNVLDQPFNDALDKYKLDASRLATGAGMEEKDNTNKSQFYRNFNQDQYNTRKADTADTIAENKRVAEETRAEIAQQRADTMEYLAKNPKHVIQAPKGGNLTAIDPITNVATVITDKQGNPIKSGTLTDTDKINLQNAGRLQDVKESGAQARETDKQKAGEASTLEDKKIGGRGDLADKNNKAKAEREQAALKLKADLFDKAQAAKKAMQVDSTLEEVKDKNGNVIGTKKMTVTRDGGTVLMSVPNGDGTFRDVPIPSDKVDEAIKRGAKRK